VWYGASTSFSLPGRITGLVGVQRLKVQSLQPLKRKVRGMLATIHTIDVVSQKQIKNKNENQRAVFLLTTKCTKTDEEHTFVGKIPITLPKVLIQRLWYKTLNFCLSLTYSDWSVELPNHIVP